MDSFLALSRQDQKLLIEQTAARKGWMAGSVEKDFWVCWTLRQLFALPALAGHLTFKGGTSLSKAWGLIDRFSEDIDLTIGRDALGFGGENSPEQAATSKQQAKRLKALRGACGEFVRHTLLSSLNQQFAVELGVAGWTLAPDADDADGQTLLFQYPAHFGGGHGRYVRAIVKIEFGARSDPWPAHERMVQPVMAEAYPQAFLAPCTQVLALAPERTFWEKAMLLHEEGCRPEGKIRRARLARHYYDLYRLINGGIAARAVADADLFYQVLAHRRVFFAHTWVDYDAIRTGALRMVPPAAQEASWRHDYLSMQDEMFSAPPPSFDELLAVVRHFESTFRPA